MKKKKKENPNSLNIEVLKWNEITFKNKFDMSINKFWISLKVNSSFSKEIYFALTYIY